MKKVKEFMDCYSQGIIKGLGKKEFDTHDIVAIINQQKKLQEEYIKLSAQYGSYNKLNAQIGRYLRNNQKQLGISKNGGKEISTANTLRESKNQKWKILFVSFLFLCMGMSAYTQPQQNAERDELITEVETVLDNDYYSADCPPVEVLEKLREQLKERSDQIEKLRGTTSFFAKIEEGTYLLELQNALSGAIKKQTLTKQYGATTAKKIMAGEYEIGMSKAIVEEIMWVNGSNPLYYKKSISASTELWQFDYNCEALQFFDLKTKNMMKAKCPTFTFRGGKLTEIIR